MNKKGILYFRDNFVKGFHPFRDGLLKHNPHTGSGSLICEYVKMLGVLAATTLIGVFFDQMGVSEANIITVFILGVLFISVVTTHHYQSVIASLLGVMIFNFLFTEPRFTLRAHNTEYPITFIVMFLASFITSSLTTQIRKQALLFRQKSRLTEVLLETSQLLQRANSEEEIYKCAARQIQRLLGRSATFQQVWNEKTAPAIHHSSIESEAAGWVAKHGRKAGAGTSQFPEAQYLYMAINGHRGVLAVVILEMEGHPAMDEFEKNLLVSMLGECALAIEKEEANTLRNKAALQAQNEQLRANLMRAVSHDLRTPLTSISGNAALLLENADSLSDDRRSLLYRDIQEEAQWLNRLVENLLSVTRIENGSMDIRLVPELMSEVIREAITHLERLRTGHVMDVELSDDLLMGKMDSRLVVQLLINLVDNAFKYTDPGGRVRLCAMRQQSFVLVRVEDEGPGIPEELKENLFGMFVTLDSRESDRRRGMGLGLYLCRAIVHAHGGEIWVEDREQGGAAFCFTLPAEEVPFGDETESSGHRGR